MVPYLCTNAGSESKKSSKKKTEIKYLKNRLQYSYKVFVLYITSHLWSLDWPSQSPSVCGSRFPPPAASLVCSSASLPLTATPVTQPALPIPSPFTF